MNALEPRRADASATPSRRRGRRGRAKSPWQDGGNAVAKLPRTSRETSGAVRRAPSTPTSPRPLGRARGEVVLDGPNPRNLPAIWADFSCRSRLGFESRSGDELSEQIREPFPPKFVHRSGGV